MTTKTIAWSDGTWGTPPASIREVGGHLVVEAVEGSDYWEKTLYGFEHASGHSLLAAWEGDRAVEVSFRLRGLAGLYDQAGLMLWQGSTSWIKAGVELIDGVPHLGAVVTERYSDWSLAAVQEWADRVVTLRASRSKDAVIIRACAAGEAWRTIRVARFPEQRGTMAGPFVCAPKRAGLTVTFTHFAHTDPDVDLHTAPPLPKEAER